MASTWNGLQAERLVEDGALLRSAAEALADPFEPALCDQYARLFSEAIGRVLPELDPGRLLERYQRIRQPNEFRGEARSVFVLSRVTLGADVAVTSVLLDAAKRRFPGAELVLAGPRKNWELFAGDGRVGHLPVVFPRAGLREQLALWPQLCESLSTPDAIVIDPDSRISQLGLLPLGAEERYLFFESRAYGGLGAGSLPELARRWAAGTLGVPDARPYVALAGSAPAGRRPLISVSLGVGENPAKRIPDPFERELLQALARRDARIWIDRGPGGEEAARVDRAIEGLNVRAWNGPFAGFAAVIAASDLYVGYDSAGQHVAAACGTPLVSVFAGFRSPRAFERWRPSGRGAAQVVRVEHPDPREVLAQVLEAIDNIRL
ncbi:MAG: glycosyltransferase family 9 protein [Acidobacteria bacterium]|nr:glycosyltransferase family 9 protein [Acidobacteriota bacterium]